MSRHEDELRDRLTTGAPPSDFDPDALWAGLETELPAGRGRRALPWRWGLGALLLLVVAASFWWAGPLTEQNRSGAKSAAAERAGVAPEPLVTAEPEGGGAGARLANGGAGEERPAPLAGSPDRAGRSTYNAPKPAPPAVLVRNEEAALGVVPSPDRDAVNLEPVTEQRAKALVTTILPESPVPPVPVGQIWLPPREGAIRLPGEDPFKKAGRGRFALGVHLGSGLETYRLASSAAAASTRLLEESLRPALGQSGEIDLTYRISDHLSLRLGAGWRRTHTVFSLVERQDTTLVQPLGPDGTLTAVPAEAIRTVRHNNFQREVVLPLVVSYGRSFRRWRLGLGVGVGYHLLLGQAGRSLSTEGTVVDYGTARGWAPESYWSFRLEPSLAYAVSERLSLTGRLGYAGGRYDAALGERAVRFRGVTGSFGVRYRLGR